MNDFKIRRGKYNLAGENTDVWLVIDTKAVARDFESIAAIILPGDSGKALVEAMLIGGATEA